MTDHLPDADALLSGTAELRRVVRAAQRATWFPLAVFALLTFGAVPVTRYGHTSTTCASSGHGRFAGRVCTFYTAASFVYWAIALVVGYVAIVAFYRWRAQRRGVGSHVQPYVIVGVVLAAVVTAIAIYHAHNPGEVSTLFGVPVDPNSAVFRIENRLISPEAAIGVALLILAWVERSVLLLGFTIVYLGVVANGTALGWSPALRSSARIEPRIVIPAVLLTIGALLFAAYQRRGSRR